MRKDSCKGWKNVFSFTLTQTLKSKAYRGSLIFMLLLILVSMPLMNLIMSDSTLDGTEASNIDTVYVFNMTVYQNLDFESELMEGYRKIKFERTTESYEAIEKKLTDGEEKNAVILMLVEDDANCYLQFSRSPMGDVNNMELQLLAQSIQNAYMKARIKTLGITEQQVNFLSTSVMASAGVIDTESAVTLEDTSISQSEYWFIYGVMFVVLMVAVMASSQVATSIVTEKSSKVLEYVMTSIRPLALIVGKVFAMLVAVLIQITVTILGGYISTQIGKLVNGGAPNAITQFITPEILENLNPLNIIICVIVAAAGMVLYATLAGLCGATVSRMEEASESLTLLTIVSLVGFYIGMIASGTLMGGGSNAFATFALLFPISSAFLLPGALLIGRADLWIAILAIVILFISTVLLFRFVARVYETLILHNGSRIRMKEVFAISKSSKKGAKGQR